MSDHWIQTYTGKAFDLLAPDPSQVCIDDIAHALGNIARYNGHTVTFYSVAQHSVLLANYLAEIEAPIEHQRWALLHDAAETYVCDIPRPLKSLLTGYADIEARIQEAICVRFNLDVEMPPIVKEIDNRILADERACLMRECARDWNLPYQPLGIFIDPWAPWTAKTKFRMAFNRLFPSYVQQKVE